MLHFSKITTPGKDFNLIASGALAYKIHNKILSEAEFRDHTSVTQKFVKATAITSSSATKDKIFFVVISDLDKINTEALCEMISSERAMGGYAVCEVIPMLYNEPSLKALKLLRQTFDEVLELGKFNLGSSQALINAEQQNCIITDYSVSMARIIYNLCVPGEPATGSKKKYDNLVYADSNAEAACTYCKQKQPAVTMW